MQQRFTFIKTDEVFDGESEERVEVEVGTFCESQQTSQRRNFRFMF